MKEFWSTNIVKNPFLNRDLKTYFFYDEDDSFIDKLVEDNLKSLTILCDRYEFILNLLKIKELLLKNRKNSISIIKEIDVNGEKVIEVTPDESITFQGYEFNAINFDIDALCQYLLLTMIDTVMGNSKYVKFVEWLNHNKKQRTYEYNELKELQDEYYEDNGLGKNFMRAFNNYLSKETRQRILNTFIIAKNDLGRINDVSLQNWNNLDDNKKFKKIITYFYDQIRCNYTHNCGRNFLNNRKVENCFQSKKEKLINIISPQKDNILEILKDSVKEIVINKFTSTKNGI